MNDPLLEAFQATRAGTRLLARFPTGSLPELAEATRVLGVLQSAGDRIVRVLAAVWEVGCPSYQLFENSNVQNILV